MKACAYAALSILIAWSSVCAQSDPTAKAVAAAKALLSDLDDAQRAAVKVDLTRDSRTKWSNLPNGALPFKRNGLKLSDFSPSQQEAALALVAAALSPEGYKKVIDIVNADEDLARTTASRRPGANRVRFGKAEYYIAILGEPSLSDAWMIQFGGHHLALNLTIVGAHDVLAPSHTGAQPSVYVLDGRTIRPLGNENDKAFALINALSEEQRKQAILNYRVADTVLGPGHDGEIIEPEGVRVSSFTAEQRKMLLDLIREWVGILNAPAASAKMEEIRSRLDDTYFAWSGPIDNGSPAYFRIQGPAVEIEYAPQGGSVDHIHTFYRDPTNDYGAKFIER